MECSPESGNCQSIFTFSSVLASTLSEKVRQREAEWEFVGFVGFVAGEGGFGYVIVAVSWQDV
jgi:hypothetical protein